MPYPAQGYPFTLSVNGSTVGAYCQLADVQARVLSGQWNPANPNQGPTTAQVDSWIAEATAMMDSVLAKRGYYVPLRVQASYPGGSIAPTAYLILQNVCAAYVVHHVEQARHGSVDKDKDSNASEWLSYADDIIARFENGDDDLAAWGVDGGFEPELDPATGAQLGSAIDTSTGLPTTPYFSRDMGPF